ncbi:hypothetical protein CCR75_003842 [Bremia lactucae]|uniref:BSD domain-containing protein n=1 Tax=Bremia lactucae TaxID=4779 RepID=A0A976IL93_BRELC|nr:hypothetical protein CCR75_003842 [Bremia lactucae]
MSFSSFYSVVNAIKDKSVKAINTLSSDLEDFKSVVREDVAELTDTVRQNMQEGRLSIERRDDNESNQDKELDTADDGSIDPSSEDTDEDPLTLLRNSLFSFDVTSSLHSVSNSVQDSLTSVQGSWSSVGSKLTSINVSSSLGSLEAMGSKLLNSADEFLGTLAGETVYNEDDDISEYELNARRSRLLALQEDSRTYIDSPLEVATFEKWKFATQTEELVEIQTEILENYPTVGVKLLELVPSVVEADVFWMHYIYKASLLAAHEQRGADLLEHVLNHDEKESRRDVASPKAQDDEGPSIFPDEECKETDVKVPVSCAGLTSSSDGEGWIELDERKESPASLKEPISALTDLKVVERDEAVDEVSLDWGDDVDLIVPEIQTNVLWEEHSNEITTATHEDSSKRGEDWGEWD